ncbi:hypothetical protein Tco_0664702 [Tanacetum coccineum]
MNILLQGLPKDIYTLINHYNDAKDIWDNVKMLLEGSELTKDERESQLYDEFKHSRQNKGETIHEYYVRFTKLINDMRNIKMTMPKMQLNSKFVNNMLSQWDRFVTSVKLNRGLKTSNYDQLYAYLKQHEAHANENEMMLERYNQHAIDPLAFLSNGRQNRGHGNYARGSVAAGNGGVHNIVRNANPGQTKPIKCYNYNGIWHIARQCTHPKRPQNLEYFKDKMLLMQAQENGVVLDEDQWLFIAPTAQTMFMANLSLVDLIYDEAGPSYDLDIISEVQDHDNYLDSVGEYHEVHERQDNVQLNYVVDSDAEYTSDILFLELYEKRERFELTEREQKIDEKLRIIITDRNYKEESLKKELQVMNMQLNSTINHNKSMIEEVTTLKKDFKQKENKHLEDFFDMKALKEKVEDKLFKQDESLQIIHMLCKQKPYYDEKKKVEICYKNPLYLTSAMQVQSALYNGHEIVKNNHAPAVVHDSEDTLELSKITRKIMLKKVKIPLCVEKRVMIAPPDYSKDNYLATFTPQRHLNRYFRHFEGIQTALVKEVKEMKEIFEQMEAEVEQNGLDKQCADIERKNLLIENENLIADCLSYELLYSVMNEVNNVSRFSKMHDAFTVEQARCLELEAEISKLKHKIQKDDHSEMINVFPTLRTENAKIKQHYKELYDSIKIMRAKTIEKTTSLLTKIKSLKAQLKGKMKCVTMDTVKPKVLTLGVNSSTEASGSKPRSNTKKNRILPAKSDNKKKVEAHPRNNKSKLKQENRVDSSISFKHAVISLNSKSMCKTCNKCLISANHDKCVVKYLKSVNAPLVKNVLSKVKQVWKATGKLFSHVGYQWRPTRRKFVR